MPSTYSPNLAIELPATGEQSGLWGITTNDNLGVLLEEAVTGYTSQVITDGADTVITIPNGATGIARHMSIECTGGLTSNRNLLVPAKKKLYIIYNNTTGGYAVTIKVSGQTGVVVPPGQKILLLNNGTDVVVATNYMIAPSFLTPALGTPSSGNAANIVGLPLSTGVSGVLPIANGGTSSSTATGTGPVVLGTSPTLNTPTINTPTINTPVWGSSTGTGAVVLQGSPTINTPTLTAPVLGTPSSGTLTNCTALPIDAGTVNTLPVNRGGTGATTLTLNNVLLGNGAGSPQFVAPGATGNLLRSDGTTWGAVAEASVMVTTLTGTANQITVSASVGPVTISIPTNGNGYGVRTVSAGAPSGGADGDVWYKI
jgi:hypothetical protein